MQRWCYGNERRSDRLWRREKSTLQTCRGDNSPTSRSVSVIVGVEGGGGGCWALETARQVSMPWVGSGSMGEDTQRLLSSRRPWVYRDELATGCRMLRLYYAPAQNVRYTRSFRTPSSPTPTAVRGEVVIDSHRPFVFSRSWYGKDTHVLALVKAASFSFSYSIWFAFRFVWVLGWVWWLVRLALNEHRRARSVLVFCCCCWGRMR